MKLINPAGTSSVGNEPITPFACMCSTISGFATAKSPNDNCFHCGCSCSNNNVNSGNASRATWTIRASGSFE